MPLRMMKRHRERNRKKEKFCSFRFQIMHISFWRLYKFYELVFGDTKAFYRLCMALPQIIEDVVSENEAFALNNTVYEELTKGHADLLIALYLLAFSTYEGFDQIVAK